MSFHDCLSCHYPKQLFFGQVSSRIVRLEPVEFALIYKKCKTYFNCEQIYRRVSSLSREIEFQLNIHDNYFLIWKH